jgi:ATP-dependent helicase HrpA
LVPGMRLEKITAVFRALPKAQRKLLVPVPDYAKAALQDLERDVSRLGRLPGFHEWLAQWVTQHVGAPVSAADLAALALPDYLRMNIRVLDANDRVIATGRDLLSIKRKLYGANASLSGGTTVRGARITAHLDGSAEQPLHKQWDFGELSASREVERNGLKLVVYPALEDRGTGVALVEARNATAAEVTSRAGLTRLAMLVLPQQARYVSKRMADDRDLVLLSRRLELQHPLADAMTQRSFREAFFPDELPLPRDADAFARRLEEHRAQLSDTADRLALTVTSVFKEWRAVRSGIDSLRPGSFTSAVGDVEAQLRVLLPPDFIEATPRPWLDYLPRYLKAITRRIERLRSNERRDSELAAKVQPFSCAVRALIAEPALGGPRPEVDQLRWMVEEFRVSLFAQELKTMLRVSEKRLAEQLALARESQR